MIGDDFKSIESKDGMKAGHRKSLIQKESGDPTKTGMS